MDEIEYQLNEDSPKSLQPSSISISLKPHQLASIYRMCLLDRDCGMSINLDSIRVQSNVGILGDLPGYGKTISFLTMIQELKEVETQWMPQAQTFINDRHGIIWTKKQTHNCIETTLIVVPDNLVDHWQRHLDDYTKLEYEIVEKDNYTKIFIEGYDIVLCPAKFYNRFVRHNNDYFWNRVAFDEADSIKIPNTAFVKTRFLWLITATYQNIPKRKNLGFLRNLFYKQEYRWGTNVIDKYFTPVVVKGTEPFIKKSFSLIEPEFRLVRCQTPNFLHAVRNHISPRVLEMINAGDMDGAILALGGNIDDDRNIIEIVTRTLKNEIIVVEDKIGTLSRLKITKAERREKRKRLEEKLNSLNTRRKSLEKSIGDASKSDCVICCDMMSSPTLVPCCNNMFCAECLFKWMEQNDKCPFCRGSFDPSELCLISKDKVKKKRSKPKEKRKDKLGTLLDIIKDKPERRFIVFSGHDACFCEVGDGLRRDHIKFGVLTTSLKTEKALRAFREGEISVILLNAEHNGAGLEIQTATDVVLFHQMRKSLELQAIGRAQRPGRSGQLIVWRLLYEHE